MLSRLTRLARREPLPRAGCARRGFLRRPGRRGGRALAGVALAAVLGVAVLPSTAQAEAADSELSDAALVGGISPSVDALAFKGTPAAGFTNQRRQLSGFAQAGTYVALYAVGYADSRPREPVAGDTYADAEMTTMASGVAQTVLAEVGAPLPSPHCPGTPGC